MLSLTSAIRVAARKAANDAHKAQIALMKFLSEVARRQRVGDHVYVVGGAVRNFVIDRPIKDIDVVIDAVSLSERFRKKRDSEWFAQQLQRVIPAKTNLTTNQYGVAILTVRGDWMLDGYNLKGEVIEIANARKESYGGEAGKGYKPDQVVPATIEEDLLRREFTFNTLLWRLQDLASGPEKAEIIDLTGCGLRDLNNMTMRCPRDPDIVFSDDPTRMLRAIKFSTKYGFKIPRDLAASIRKNAQKMKQAPWEAIASIFINNVLNEPTAPSALRQMKSLGLLDVVAEMVQEKKPFASYLRKQLRNRNVALLLDLLDLGLTDPSPLAYLTRDQQERLREITVPMDSPDADAFAAVLAKPSVNNKTFITEFSLQGADRALPVQYAREALLENPDLADNPMALEKEIRDLFRSKGTRRTAAPKKYDHIDFTPPEGVANAAAKGLELRQKASPSNRGGLTSEEAGKQGIGSGVQRAVNLKNRDTISPKVIKQMRGFLSRSEKSSKISPENKGTPWNDKGYVAWLLWGGDPAKAWVEKIIKQMEAADEKEKQSKQAALMERWGSMLVTADENEPTNPKLWAKVQALAKGEQASMTHGGKTVNGPNDGKGFRIFPSAYANGWASKVYKDLGGGWKKKAGWWQSESGIIGDGPADVMQDAVDDIRSMYRDHPEIDREPTLSELWDTLGFVTGPEVESGETRVKMAAETGDGSEHVGVFASLPADLAKQFPKKDEDSSKAHVTLCYIGPVPDKQDQKVLVEAVRDLYADVVGPIEARLSGVDYFRHANGSVAYAKVVFSKDVGHLKDRLKSLLEDHGIEITDDHPLAFNPHVTLAYYDDPHAVWDGPVPKGSWTFNEVEVWGLPKIYRLPVGGSYPTRRASLTEAWGPTLRTAARYKCVPEGMRLIDYTRGYKQISKIRRIPIAKENGEVVVGLEDITDRDLLIRGKPYMGTDEMEALFSDEVVIEEKVDGHPMIALYEGYTFFCESLKVRHSVDYDACPYSVDGWPDMLVVYEVMDGEHEPPYSPGFGTGKWLTRSEKEAVCRMVGAPVVPATFKGRISPEEVPNLAAAKSGFGSGQAEGVVIKNLKKGIFGKFVNIEFQKKITDEETWGGVHPERLGIKNVRRFAEAWGPTLREARGKAKKDVGHGGLDEWFSGHGGAKGKGEDATWGDWVSISPVTKTLPSGKKVEKGDIVGPCGISDDPDWKEITKGGEDPLKCMPRQKAYDMPKAERAEKAKAKQRAEQADSSRGKKPTMTPTFDKKKGKTACIIAAGQWDGHKCLFKNRDRNYTPKVKVYHVLRDGVEILYMKDEITGWCEGLNSSGIGIVNSALAVAKDEKEKQLTEEDADGATLRDGKRVLEALSKTSVDDAVESIKAFDEGLKGHTFVADTDRTVSLEATWEGHDYHVRQLANDKKHVRTNHGQYHQDAGYTEEDGDDYLSSLARRDQAMKVIREVDGPKDIAPAIYGKRRKDRSDPLNMVKLTDGMKSTSQIVLDLSDLVAYLYLLPDQIEFQGYESDLPEDYEPKISLEIYDYDPLGDDGEFEVKPVKLAASWGLTLEQEARVQRIYAKRAARIRMSTDWGPFMSKELVPGGLARGKDPGDFDKSELDMGRKVEREHFEGSDLSDKEIDARAQEIAMDHLMELSDYYTRLKKMEQE